MAGEVAGRRRPGAGGQRPQPGWRDPGGSGQAHAVGDVRALYAAEIEILLALVNAHLRTASGRTEYTYLLECVLGFEGVMSWSEELEQRLRAGGARGRDEAPASRRSRVFGDATCPDCATGLCVADRITGDRSVTG